MKRIAWIGCIVGLVLPLMAFATPAMVQAALFQQSGSVVTQTVNADFASGNALFDNVTSASNDLRVTSIDNVAGDWYRGHYNGSDWQIDVDKDTNTASWAGDTCLRVVANSWSNVSRIAVPGSNYFYRTGPANDGTHALGVASGTTIMSPSTTIQASTVRFLSHGAKVADSRYVVTVDRQSGSDLVFSIPVPAADITSRDGTGAGPDGSSWTRKGVTGIFAASSNPDCLGDAGDEIVIQLPAVTEVRSIEIAYTTETSPGINGEWLGGPVALSVETVQGEIEESFTWRGTYRSASNVSAAVSSPDGTGGVWFQASWSDSAFGSESDVELFVRCGTDLNANGIISSTEWQDKDGGVANAWQAVGSLRQASPLTFDTCTGTHLQYRTELYPEFDASPRINSISLHYNPDVDRDGYPADTLRGNPRPTATTLTHYSTTTTWMSMARPAAMATATISTRWSSPVQRWMQTTWATAPIVTAMVSMSVFRTSTEMVKARHSSHPALQSSHAWPVWAWQQTPTIVLTTTPTSISTTPTWWLAMGLTKIAMGSTSATSIWTATPTAWTSSSTRVMMWALPARQLMAKRSRSLVECSTVTTPIARSTRAESIGPSTV